MLLLSDGRVVVSSDYLEKNASVPDGCNPEVDISIGLQAEKQEWMLILVLF